jgi:hypothetical protein
MYHSEADRLFLRHADSLTLAPISFGQIRGIELKSLGMSFLGSWICPPICMCQLINERWSKQRQLMHDAGTMGTWMHMWVQQDWHTDIARCPRVIVSLYYYVIIFGIKLCKWCQHTHKNRVLYMYILFRLGRRGEVLVAKQVNCIKYHLWCLAVDGMTIEIIAKSRFPTPFSSNNWRWFTRIISLNW